MIKVEEIAEKYKGYEVDEEKLKEFLTPPKPKTVWDLKESDKYWYISDYGKFVKVHGLILNVRLLEELLEIVS